MGIFSHTAGWVWIRTTHVEVHLVTTLQSPTRCPLSQQLCFWNGAYSSKWCTDKVFIINIVLTSKRLGTSYALINTNTGLVKESGNNSLPWVITQSLWRMQAFERLRKKQAWQSQWGKNVSNWQMWVRWAEWHTYLWPDPWNLGVCYGSGGVEVTDGVKAADQWTLK